MDLASLRKLAWVARGTVKHVRAVASMAPAPHEREITKALAERACEHLGSEAVKLDDASTVVTLTVGIRSVSVYPWFTLRKRPGPGGVEALLRRFGAALLELGSPEMSSDEATARVELTVDDDVILSWEASDGTTTSLKPFARSELGV